jgi:hypothetical protein
MAKKKAITPKQVDEIVDQIPDPTPQEEATLSTEELQSIQADESNTEQAKPESEPEKNVVEPEPVKVVKTKLYCFKYTGPVRSYKTHFDIDRHDCLIDCVDSVVQTDDPILGEYIKARIKDLGMEEIK